MNFQEAKEILEACEHDGDLYSFLTDCMCDYCVSDREYAVEKAEKIVKRLIDMGFTLPIKDTKGE